MHWTDEVLQPLPSAPPAGSPTINGQPAYVINDSKTPSGRAHVGALRGVLIHDAVFRTLRARNTPVIYRFGCDDYDPVDELPAGMKEHYAQYLGQPLCNTPAPPGSGASDMADHFITDFWSVFKDLGVSCEFYRMRDVYRSGQFDAAIDRILRAAATVREVYKKVSNAQRPDTWIPFQVICENCQRIGTTECSNYTGATVDYHCKPNLVTWAKGCDHRGTVSPFKGAGKLPWKLEWVAKWATFPVAIEGAGEDHCTKGGSRDVAAACLKAIYNLEAPLNIPYSFVLVGGAKMSSSKGLGVAARQVADFLPPEVLRFTILRTKPKSQANFEPTEEALIKVFNELDRAHHKTFSDPKFPEQDKRTFHLSETTEATQGPSFDAEFQLVLALVQMPHLDIYREFDRIKGSALTPIERGHLDRRIHAARYFLANLAGPDERLTLQSSPPPRTVELAPTQRAFCHVLADQLAGCDWNADAMQAAVFDAARLTPIDQPSAFLAFYRVLLDNTRGPKAGNFLAFLKRDDLLALFRAVPQSPTDEAAFLADTASSIDEVRAFAQDGKIKAMHAVLRRRVSPIDLSLASAEGAAMANPHSFIDIHLVMDDNKQHTRRVPVPACQNPGDTERELRKVLPVQLA
jgi:lysyl-tRNA synthetase, class I